jgi:hypothetical protein
MPLSEQEQRLLEEMERSLYQHDADFVATVGASRGRVNYTMLVAGILVGVLGVAALVTGVVIQQTLVGILGFVVMFIGVLLAVTPSRRAVAAAKERPASGNSPRGRGSFMDRMNQRWERRMDDRDR